MEIIGRGLHSGVDGHRLKKKKKKIYIDGDVIIVKITVINLRNTRLVSKTVLNLNSCRLYTNLVLRII